MRLDLAFKRLPATSTFDAIPAAIGKTIRSNGLAQRTDIANQLARRVATSASPDVTLEAALGPLASSETRKVIARAESRQQALTLLFMAPEFQRR